MKSIIIIIMAGFGLVMFSGAEAVSYPTTFTRMAGPRGTSRPAGTQDFISPSSDRINYSAPRLSYAPAYSLAQTANVANAFQNPDTVVKLPKTGGGGKAKNIKASP